MQAIGNWLISEHGIAAWIVGLFVLPGLAVLLIIGLREIMLKIVQRIAGDRMHTAVWRRGTRYLVIFASLVAIGLILKAFAPSIASVVIPDNQAHVETILLGLVRLVFSTAILALLLVGLKRGFATLDGRLESWHTASGGFHFQNVVLVESGQAAGVLRIGLRILRFGLILFLFYLYIPVAMSSIPATERLAKAVMPFVLQPLAHIGLAIVGYIPNLITVILIIVVFVWVYRLLRIFMSAVGSGDIKLGSFDPAWADQTYRLVHILGIIFAIIVIYPFLPGSDSSVFKGVSVFVGAVITFGGRSSIDNLISGVILTYNKTFEVGDRVRVGNAIGDVMELGLFVTLVRTLDGEQVTVPNTVIMQQRIVNLSEASKAGGLKLRLAVGIGYDTEWQQVHDLLISAAKKTSNVRSDPKPIVEQTSLDNYAVTYTLVVALEDLKILRATRSELLENIQDAFNEAGLEIMTPAVRAIRNSLDPAIPDKYTGAPDSPTRFRLDRDT